MNRVCLAGPTFCSQLNWNGTLTRSDTGFKSFFARSALSAAAGFASCPRLSAGAAIANTQVMAIAVLYRRSSAAARVLTFSMSLVMRFALAVCRQGRRVDGGTDMGTEGGRFPACTLV